LLLCRCFFDERGRLYGWRRWHRRFFDGECRCGWCRISPNMRHLLDRRWKMLGKRLLVRDVERCEPPKVSSLCVESHDRSHRLSVCKSYCHVLRSPFLIYPSVFFVLNRGTFAVSRFFCKIAKLNFAKIKEFSNREIKFREKTFFTRENRKKRRYLKEFLESIKNFNRQLEFRENSQTYFDLILTGSGYGIVSS